MLLIYLHFLLKIKRCILDRGTKINVFQEPRISSFGRKLCVPVCECQDILHILNVPINISQIVSPNFLGFCFVLNFKIKRNFRNLLFIFLVNDIHPYKNKTCIFFIVDQHYSTYSLSDAMKFTNKNLTKKSVRHEKRPE